MSLVARYSSSSDDEEIGDSISGNQPSVSVPPVPVASCPPKTAEGTSVDNNSSRNKGFSNFKTSLFVDSDEDDPDDTMEVENAEDVPPISSSLKSLLPQPKKKIIDSSTDDVEIGPIPPKKIYEDESSKKKPNKPVKITIPSLKDFAEEDEDEAPKKKFVPSKSGSGLFAILPEPKGVMNSRDNSSKVETTEYTFKRSNQATESDSGPSTSAAIKNGGLVPHSVSRKRPAESSKDAKLEEIKAKYMKSETNFKITTKNKKKVEKDVDSDEEGGADTGSFFSLDSPDVEMLDSETLEKLKLPTPNFDSLPAPAAQQNWNNPASESYYDNTEPSASSSKPVDIMQYVKGEKRKKEALNIIDISADDLRPDNNEWIKNITDKSAVPPRRGKGLTGMVKRKHQITYLAHEAKAREEELQNQWAQNRMSRRQTQSKYGF